MSGAGSRRPVDMGDDRLLTGRALARYKYKLRLARMAMRDEFGFFIFEGLLATERRLAELRANAREGDSNV